VSIDGLELAELSAKSKLHGELDVRQVAALRAGLKHLARAADRFRQDQALRDVLRARLFAVYVLAGVGRQHGRRGMPVRARGNQHGVDVFAGQQVTKIAIGSALRVAVVRINARLDRLRPRRFAPRPESHALSEGRSDCWFLCLRPLWQYALRTS
jgi:hypothetical protein